MASPSSSSLSAHVIARLLPAVWIALSAGQVFAQGPGAPPQQQAEKRIAILGLEAGEGLDAVAGSVTRSVRRVASVRRGWRVAAEGSLGVTEAKLTYACLDEDPACWAQVGGALNVDLIVAGSVDPGEADRVAVTLLLYDVHEVRLVDRLERVFPRERLDRSVSDAARKLLAPAAKPAPAPSPPMAAVAPPHAPASGGAPPGGRSAESSPPPSGPNGGSAAGGAQPSSRRFLGWGILGAGATLAGVGLLFGLLAQDAASEFDLAETPERRAHELKDEGESYAAGANALYGVGAALAVTGAVLLVATPAEAGEAGVAGVGVTGVGVHPTSSGGVLRVAGGF